MAKTVQPLVSRFRSYEDAIDYLRSELFEPLITGELGAQWISHDLLISAEIMPAAFGAVTVDYFA